MNGETTILIADSVVETILFDVIYTNTNAQVKKNNEPVRPSCDFLLMPSGLGFQQQLDIVAGDTIDYVVQQIIKKKDIKLSILWRGKNAYAKYRDFSVWVATYFDLTTYHIRFSYEIGGARRYVEVAATNLELSGREGNVVRADLTMKPLTPFYEETVTSFIVNDTNTGKIYNYVYPFSYGGGAYSGSNLIKNEYIKSLPLRIVLKGPIAVPYVSISKINEDGEVDSTPYGRVQFATGISLTENDTITIDAFNNKIYLTSINPSTNAITTTDLFNSVDKTYDAFLFAKSGSSRIAATLDDSDAECTVYFVRYVL